MGCTIEDRTVEHERVAAYIVGVAGVALGSMAAAAPRVLVAAVQAVDDADFNVHIAGAAGTTVLVAGFAGSASARPGCCSRPGRCCPDLTALAWTYIPIYRSMAGSLSLSLSVCSWAREKPARCAREATGPSRRDGLCPLGCQGRLFLADSTARAWRCA